MKKVCCVLPEDLPYTQVHAFLAELEKASIRGTIANHAADADDSDIVVVVLGGDKSNFPLLRALGCRSRKLNIPIVYVTLPCKDIAYVVWWLLTPP